MTFEELKAYLDGWAIERSVDEVEEYLISQGAKYNDEWIDNGTDTEGEYVMGECYEFDGHYINLYYSNINPLVGCIEYR